MEQTLLKIRDEQQASWNQFSPGWKRWEAWTRMMLEPIGTAIINELRLHGNEHVLDIATGAGEPGLTIAANLPHGRVTGADISEGMLHAAGEAARNQGLYNYETVQADACDLPFDNGSFDAVSCRHGFMFFPDVAVGAIEAVRVLKSGGRLATSIWAPSEENLWASTVTSVVKRHTVLPMQKQNLFRCSAPGMMADTLLDAGLIDVQENIVRGVVNFSSAEGYWRHFTSVVMPVAKAIGRTDIETQRTIRKEVFSKLEECRTESGVIALGYAAVVVSGTKP